MNWKLRTGVALGGVIVLAAAGALAGLGIEGTVGAAAGAILGALAGVIAGYVPAIRDKAKQRSEEKVAVQARWNAAREPQPDRDDEPGPSVWLRPEQAVVEFTGRECELAELQSWCGSGPARSVRVLAGPGGVGKTRLALHLAAEWQAAGRQWLLVAAGREAEAMAAARGAMSGPVLLIVDYAETRTGLGGLLRAVLDDPGWVRVLLLARSLGEWWDRLAEESAPAVGRLLTGQEPIRLAAPIAGDVPDAALAAAAVPFFARKLGVPMPTEVVFELPTARVPVLVLHTAALVAVLRSAAGTALSSRVSVNERVLAELLEHEARYWRRTAKAGGLPGDGPVLKAVVAATILLGAADLAEAADVARRVPDLAGQPAGELRAWGRWLYGLYPAASDGRLGSVQPDLLAEAHAVAQLAAVPDLARACLWDLGEDQARRALTVLARSWELHEEAGPVISAALHANLADLAVAASAVAIQTSARMGEPLAAALRNAPASLEALIRVEEALPYPSVALANADAAVTTRIRRELPSGTDPETIAKWAHRAGTVLSQIGRSAEALAVAEEAVAIRRELAAAMPDRYRSDLAMSLSNLGVTFSELGRPAEALAVTEEAVAICRELAAAMPDRYRSDLAMFLTNLGVSLSELGRPAEALAVTEEAVAIRRELAAAMPDRYRSDLATSLTNLSAMLSESGRPAEGLVVTEEAVAVYRELAAAMPDRYRSDLAASLSNLGLKLLELGRTAEGLVVTEEAVAVYRELAAAMPDRYRSDLAISLSNLGLMLSGLGRPVEALPVVQEAAAIRRELAAVMPDRYRSDLAISLTNLGVSLSELGRLEEALPVTEEAVAVYRELAAAMPDRYRSDLATSLSNLGVRFSDLGRPVEALPAEREAVAIRRELTMAMSDRYRSDLATSLTNLGVSLSELGRLEEALPVTEEAVAVYRELAAAMPDRYRSDLAASLSNLGLILSDLGRPVEALPAVQEAVAIRRELAAVMPDRHRPHLAISLSNLGITLWKLGRRAWALPAVQEAVAIRRELAAVMPDRYRSDLAKSLSNLSVMLLELGRDSEAAEARMESDQLRGV